MNTQRSPLIAVLLMLVASPAMALPWHWGVRAGLNAANFAGEFGDIVHPDLRYGLNAGLVGDAGLTRDLSLHVEGAYSSKGGKATQQSIDNAGNPAGTFDETWTFNYVEVPVLLRGRLRGHGNAGLFAELGPSFGIAVNGRFEPGIPGLPKRDFKKDMKPIDPDFAAGVGVEFAAGPGRLGIEARYTRGFSDLFDLADNATSINQVWTLAPSWTR